MIWHYLEKEFYDYADDIEAVNIHYVCTPHSGSADWEHQRVTRYMPLVRTVSPNGPTETDPPASELSALSLPRLRKKVLKLPLHLPGPENGEVSDRYLLHYYFEIFQDGFRHYSPLYTEEVVTTARTAEESPPQEAQSQQEVQNRRKPDASLRRTQFVHDEA